MHLIPHGDNVFSITDFLTSAECRNYLTYADEAGFSPAAVRTHSGDQMMTNVRNNERLIVNSPEWASTLWQR